MNAKAKYLFSISTSSGVPIYRQVIDQVKTAIATNRLQAGDYLPSVRQVSKDIEINPMTVSKAYSQLEKEGVLEFDRGKGMRVGGQEKAQDDLKARQEAMQSILREVRTKAKQLSLSKEETQHLLEDLWKE